MPEAEEGKGGLLLVLVLVLVVWFLRQLFVAADRTK